MWRDDEYDNLKDAILDARSLVARARKRKLAKLAARLDKMHAAAVRQLRQLVKQDSSYASYAKGLI